MPLQNNNRVIFGHQNYIGACLQAPHAAPGQVTNGGILYLTFLLLVGSDVNHSS